VRAEALVFDGDERVDEMRRDVGQAHLEAALLEDGEGRLVLHVVEHRRLGHLAHAPDVGDARQAGDDGVDRPRHADDHGELRGHHARGGGSGQPRPAGDERPQARRSALDEWTCQQ
jgi:hypothetical protein